MPLLAALHDFVRRNGPRGHVGNGDLVAVDPADHHRPSAVHAGDSLYREVDFLKFDPVAADLDLIVDPSLEPPPAAIVLAHVIAGTIEDCAIAILPRVLPESGHGLL